MKIIATFTLCNKSVLKQMLTYILEKSAGSLDNGAIDYNYGIATDRLHCTVKPTGLFQTKR